MTPTEIQNAARMLRKEIGSEAWLNVSISMSVGAPLQVSAYPKGVGHADRELRFSVEANDWAELFDKARAKWAELRAEFDRRNIRNMALEIIKITAEHGACSDAALRDANFSQPEIECYGADACKDADEMASNGPFKIVAVANANAA